MIPATDASISHACAVIADLEAQIAAEYGTADGQRALVSHVSSWDGIAPKLSRLVRAHGNAMGWLYVALERGETLKGFEEIQR